MEEQSVRNELILLAAKMLRNRGNYPTNPENYDFKLSKTAWRKLSEEHDKGDEFFRTLGIELRGLADRLPKNDEEDIKEKLASKAKENEVKDYNVTFTVDATVTVKVQAKTPEEAKEKAFDIAEAPMLCHCCANDVCIGDVLEDPAWVESVN